MHAVRINQDMVTDKGLVRRRRLRTLGHHLRRGDDTLSSPPHCLAAGAAADGETPAAAAAAAAADVPRLERAGRELEEQGFTLIPSVLCATELCALREAMEVW